MDFTSITEYFYKFSSTLLAIMLLPIMGFTAVYMLPAPLNTYDHYTDERVVISCVLVLWALAFIYFNKKIKSVRNGQGLRAKLEKYFSLTIVRFSLFTVCLLVFVTAFYFSRNDVFTIGFVAQIVLCGIVWPTASKASNDLKLRGDEREMVYYKKDKL